MIPYAKFEIEIHGLNIKTTEQVDELWRALGAAALNVVEQFPHRARAAHPSDVVVDFVEHAGTYE